jgi:predicted amidophosphoribosyltransferase
VALACQTRPAQAARVRAALLDLLLPERCAACGRPGRGLCDACRWSALPLLLAEGRPRRLAPAVVALAAYRYDGVVADAIRSVKTAGRHGAAVGLGVLLWAAVDPLLGPAVTWPRTWVPSTPARRRARGADIPRLLAGGAAVPLLRRKRHARDQTELTAAQRRVAPSGAFRAIAEVPPAVVLVDDVRTTGGTAAAAAAALRAAGTERVLVVTLAAVEGRDAR